MKRLERDSRYVELIVGVRKIVSVRQIQHRMGVTTDLGKTDGHCCGGRNPPSKSIEWTCDQNPIIISWYRNRRVRATKGALTKQEGMMSSQQWIQRGVLCGLLLTGLVGCSMVASPPVSQIASTDHAALTAWYDKEAAQLRQKAKDMELMAQRYRERPALVAIEGKHPPKLMFNSTAATLLASIRRQPKKPMSLPRCIVAW